MNQSENIQELVIALSKAQGTLKPAAFNRVNPHFKNRYADFTSCMDACRSPLSENGLAIMQYCETIEGQLRLVTMLAHTSGQWMKSEFPLISNKMDSQGIGSAMTYAKRYSLCGMIGIVADEEGDDDGEAAAGRGRNIQKPALAPVQPKSFITPMQLATIKALEEKLDEESYNKLYAWIAKSYPVASFEELSSIDATKVIMAFENAVKFVAQKKQELAHA
jgi:hypothetical protein